MPSIGAAAAIVRPGSASANNRFASKAKAAFNYGPGKTSVLPLFSADEPDADQLGCNAVEVRPVLGIVVDSQLTFQPWLDSVLRKGDHLFQELRVASECAGFSIPVVAAQVSTRVESGLLYGAEFLIGVHGAERLLNRLQQSWACSLLGARGGVRLAWMLSIAQCGWEFRPGTRMLETAVMARAHIISTFGLGIAGRRAGPRQFLIDCSRSCWRPGQGLK